MTDPIAVPPLPEPEHPADTDDCTYACPEGFSADQMDARWLEGFRAGLEAAAKHVDCPVRDTGGQFAAAIRALKG